MKPLVSNASDKEQVKNAEKKVKNLREQELDDMKYILSTRQGRRFVWRYLSICGIYEQTADQSGSWTYFKEGKRRVGLEMMADINESNPEAYITMMKEAKGD